ncbi:hypothetical protein JCM17380_20820 [Desulfosporosinus burensis]
MSKKILLGKASIEVSQLNSGKFSTSGVLVWSFFILIGSLIVYIGYRSTLSESVQNRSPITNEGAQAVSVNTVLDTRTGGANEILHTQTEDRSKSTKEDQETQQELMIVLGKNNLNEKILELSDFQCPVYGSPLRRIGNYYSESLGNYLFHAGVDYAVSEGTVIRATQGGKVTFSGSDPLLGQKVTLDCGEGWLVTFGGLDNLRVKVGETVEAQEALGQVGLYPGAEGVSDQPQLHYELWHGNEIQRPDLN